MAAPEPGRPLERGLLLVSGPIARVRRWASTGVVAVDVAPLGDWWTAIAPRSTPLAAPYDDPVSLLINRPVPLRLRPAIGWAVGGSMAYAGVQAKALRARIRWLTWRSGEGLVPPEPLLRGSVSALLRAADGADPWTASHVREVLRDPAGTPAEFLVDLMGALGVPGAQVLAGTATLPSLAGDATVSYAAHAGRVADLEDIVADEQAHDEELRAAPAAGPLGHETRGRRSGPDRRPRR